MNYYPHNFTTKKILEQFSVVCILHYIEIRARLQKIKTKMNIRSENVYARFYFNVNIQFHLILCH